MLSNNVLAHFFSYIKKVKPALTALRDCLQLLNVFSDVGAIVGLAGMTWDYLPAA